MKYFKIATLGCKVNSYESEAVRELLIQNGYREAKEESADIIIVNSCAVTKIGADKSRQKLHSLSKDNPNAIRVIMGCYAELDAGLLLKNQEADIVLGTSDKGKIIEKLKIFESGDEIISNEYLTRHRDYECLKIDKFEENTRAFLKIQDGCDNFCSYCIIPFTRGKSRSRNPQDIILEVKRLVSNNYNEIVLTGIDTANYGKDLGNIDFVTLLKTILEEVPSLRRIRISSIEASQISDELIDLIANNERIARHLHIPLQSGSNTVLKRMNRKYDVDQFYERIVALKSRLPDIALACDVIVGFPQETEEEFIETYEFIKKCDFAFLHVFPYSIRPGTRAAKMDGQISSQTKKERVRRLIELGKELENKYENLFENKEVECLIEGYDQKNECYKGLTSNYLEVRIKSTKDITGQFIKTIYQKSH